MDAPSSPVARWKDLVIDATDAERLGRFWAAALGLAYEDLPDGDAKLTGERPEQTVWVNRVPEPRTFKQRVHLDVEVGSLQPLLAAGATVLRPEGDDGIRWTVLADPEGGELCAFVREESPELASHPFELIVDCADHRAQAAWWAGVLGGDVRSRDGEHELSWLEHVPGLPYESVDFVPVPEPKSVKNRIHWDVTGDAEQLVAAGATLLRGPDDAISWSVLADPEGNEFCVFPPAS